MKTVIETVDSLIRPVAVNMGYNIVRITFGGASRPCLQIMIERLDQKGINIDDCSVFSKAVSAVLDIEDPISGEYTLEVSSAGIDRPLVKIEDYKRFSGRKVRVELSDTHEGRRRFRGVIIEVDGDQRIILDVDGERYAFSLDMIKKSKLVLTDDSLMFMEKELE